MIYNFKEYNVKFETPAKKWQERIVANKIMDLLNKKKYESLDEFFEKNNSYKNFLKNQEMVNVVKHFGNTLSEDDYKIIIDNLKQLSATKQNFEKENIKTTKIDQNEYASFEGENKNYYVDNTGSSKTIEEQMKGIQHTDQSFQTSDIKQNTENMFMELENRKKENLNFEYLHQINVFNLNKDELEIFKVAESYQNNSNKLIRIDLNKQVIIDENDNIIKIAKEDGFYKIKSGENVENKQNDGQKKENQRQLTLTRKPDTIYTNK